MYEQRFNPYAANVEIVKEYFRKPKVLVLGILYIISAILGIINVLTASTSTNYYEIMNLLDELGVDYSDISSSAYFASSNAATLAAIITSTAVTVLMAVGVILLFAKSRSANPDSSPRSGAGILHVLAVISFVCAIILTVIVGVVYLLIAFFGVSLSGNYYGNDYSDETLVVMIIVGIILAIFLALMLFFIIKRKNYYRSIKRSCAGVDLENKGATAWGVICIIEAVFYGIAVIAQFISTITSYITLHDVASLTTVIISFVILILEASVALGYSKHIKREKYGYGSYASPNGGYVPAAPYQNDPGYYPADQSYYPDDRPYYPDNQPNYPYNQPSGRPGVPYNDNFVDYNANTQERPDTCPNCGAPIDSSSPFCGNCGTKL